MSGLMKAETDVKSPLICSLVEGSPISLSQQRLLNPLAASNPTFTPGMDIQLTHYGRERKVRPLIMRLLEMTITDANTNYYEMQMLKDLHCRAPYITVYTVNATMHEVHIAI